MMADRRTARLLAAAAVVGLACRLAFGLGYWVGRPLTHDEREYLALARSLAHGQGFAYDAAHDSGTAQRFGRAPLYPLFLALVGAGAGTHTSAPARVKIAQALVGAATVWLIGAIARRAAGPRAGVAAAFGAALYPPLVWVPAYVFSETLYSLLALLAADLVQRAAVSPARPARHPLTLAAVSGLLTGAAILTRPAMLFFVPLAAAWLLLGRRRTGAAGLFVCMTAVVLLPWTLRNLSVHDRFVLVASEGGVTFWTGNHPLARGEGDLAANPDLKRAELAFRASHPGLTPEALEPLYYGDAFRFIRDEPGAWLALVARKAFYTIVPGGPSYAVHSTRYRFAAVLSHLIVLPPALAGVRRLWRSASRPSAVLLLGASAVLVCLVFFPQERFRIPVIDPVLIICASALARPAAARATAG